MQESDKSKAPTASRKGDSDRLSRFAFFASLALFVFGFGVVVGKYKIFPYQVISQAAVGFNTLMQSASGKLPKWFKHRPRMNRKLPTEQAHDGLNLVTRLTIEGDVVAIRAEIRDMQGAEVHSWEVDWYEVWPDATHLPEKNVPKGRPGTHIHGALVLEDGSLVYSYSDLGLVRLDKDSKVLWRLPYQTHHSVELGDDGHLWTCGQIHRKERMAKYPNRVPPFDEFTILELTQDGKIVNEWTVADILIENGYRGLLYMGTIQRRDIDAKGDLLHVNDVEPFPARMKPGVFGPGDLLVSMRNVNTVFVFNRETRKIKFLCTGWFVRQHDPDFVDGDRFSVYDNNHLANKRIGQSSKIVMVNARERSMQIWFEGSDAMPFYSKIMGKSQWLPNGNLLVTDSLQGRAFELNPKKELVWEWVNYVGDGDVVGLVEQVDRVPGELRKVFAK